MQKKVYFIAVDEGRDNEQLKEAFGRLIQESRALDKLKKNEFAAIKMTFGEKGNRNYVHPQVLKVLVEKIKAKQAKPFLTDSNVLYLGERTNAVDHLNLAYEHGFGPYNVNCPVVIADGFMGENSKKFPVEGKALKEVTAPAFLPLVDNLIGVAHITGHMLSGFAGQIKNIGMGLASRSGKQIQHSSSKPEIIAHKCTLCKRCFKVCPVEAIYEEDKKAKINPEKCIGCAECLPACRFGSIKIQWEVSLGDFYQKMVEYCLGISSQFRNRYYFNFAVNMTRECDCMAKEDPIVIPDLGIFAADDPLAIDKATADMILKRLGHDVFKEMHRETDYSDLFERAAQVGLGSLEYELVQLNK
jgi:uncharacterized Fe-S center protein